jgi:hypothetical protein
MSSDIIPSGAEPNFCTTPAWASGLRRAGKYIQWIGLRENLQESPIFNGKIYGFRLRFSLKPIH